MRMYVISVLATILFSASAAYADQCEAVSEDQAFLAKLVVKGADGLFTLCVPCGEKSLTGSSVKTLEVKKTGDKFALIANGKPLDLAYAYVSMPHERFRNLGMILGCTVKGQPETITAPPSSH